MTDEVSLATTKNIAKIPHQQLLELTWKSCAAPLSNYKELLICYTMKFRPNKSMKKIKQRGTLYGN